jgi:colanic acid biosynthesis protein WcaH
VFEFVSRITPLVNVDLLIQDPVAGTLLTWRDDEAYGQGWHVPGGIIRFKEMTSDRIKAVAQNELGAEVDADPVPALIYESIAAQSTRGHFVSLLYRCRLASSLEESRRAVQDPPKRGEWRWHATCPPNLIDVHSHYARFF